MPLRFVMDNSRRHYLIQQLGQAMSDVSEACYYAGWMEGTEEVVPQLCQLAVATNHPQTWGHGEVTIVKAEELIGLASRAGSWANLDEPGIRYIAYNPSSIGSAEGAA